MQRKNRQSWKKCAPAFFGAAAVLSVAGSLAFGFKSWSAERTESGTSFWKSAELIVNQGLGLGLDGTDGSFYPMELLAADRNTGFFVKIEPQVLQEAGTQPALLVSDGRDSWRFTDSEYREEYGLLCFDTSERARWEAGQYEVRVEFGDGRTLEREIVFCEMLDMEILVVPVTGYYSGEIIQTVLPDESLWEYTEKVYPLGAGDLEWHIYEDGLADFEDKRCDLDTSLGRLRVWKYLKQLYDQKDVDMVIGIVAENMKARSSAGEATVTGFTFGEDVSVISLEDSCPQVTIAHEIGHCLYLGDEYENGTFSVSMNMAPYGMKGKNRFQLSATVQGTSPYILGGAADEKQGSGTVVYAEQYPYDIFSGELIARDMTSFMGLSGYPEAEYWVTTQIWEALYEELCESGTIVKNNRPCPRRYGLPNRRNFVSEKE